MPEQLEKGTAVTVRRRTEKGGHVSSGNLPNMLQSQAISKPSRGYTAWVAHSVQLGGSLVVLTDQKKASLAYGCVLNLKSKNQKGEAFCGRDRSMSPLYLFVYYIHIPLFLQLEIKQIHKKILISYN